jgi:hypothetical protein
MEAAKGTAELVKAWAAVPAAIKKRISTKGCPEDLKEQAAAFDKQRTEAQAGGTELAGVNAALEGAE